MERCILTSYRTMKFAAENSYCRSCTSSHMSVLLLDSLDSILKRKCYYGRPAQCLSWCWGISGPPLRSGEGAFRVRRSGPSGVRFSACPGVFRDVLRCVSGPPAISARRLHAERSQNPICAERRQNRISRQRRASRESNFPRRSCVEPPQSPISQEPS